MGIEIGIDIDPDTLVLEINTRPRVVWTKDEKRRLDRCAADFNAHGDRLLMRCGQALCPDTTIRLVREPSDPRGAVLRCGCLDRVFSRDI